MPSAAAAEAEAEAEAEDCAPCGALDSTGHQGAASVRGEPAQIRADLLRAAAREGAGGASRTPVPVARTVTIRQHRTAGPAEVPPRNASLDPGLTPCSLRSWRTNHTMSKESHQTSRRLAPRASRLAPRASRFAAAGFYLSRWGPPPRLAAGLRRIRVDRVTIRRRSARKQSTTGRQTRLLLITIASSR
jgi:hypothetical protein